MSEYDSKCPQCNGETVAEYGTQCDFCNVWQCDDCIESLDFLGAGWACCFVCQARIEDFAHANNYEIDHSNCLVFMSEIKSNLKRKNK